MEHLIKFPYTQMLSYESYYWIFIATLLDYLLSASLEKKKKAQQIQIPHSSFLFKRWQS